MTTNIEDSPPNKMCMIMPQEKEGTIKFNIWVPNRHGFFLETMTFMETKYGERHMVDFYKAPLKLTEL